MGLGVVDVIVGDALADRAKHLGDRLRDGLRALQGRHQAIGDIRGRGLLLGVEIATDRETRAPGHELIVQLTDRCFELGLNVNRVGGPHSVWRLAPPLTITEEEVDEAVAIMD